LPNPNICVQPVTSATVGPSVGRASGGSSRQKSDSRGTSQRGTRDRGI
jgi:hypothetical protein